MKRNTLILAAGKSTRMKSKKSKVLHEILGKSALAYVVDLAHDIESDEIFVIVGPQEENIQLIFGEELNYVTQQQQLGTGDAVACAAPFLEEGTTLILYADVPCLCLDSLQKLYDFHEKKKNDLSILSVTIDNPHGYGRIVRDEYGVCSIVEHADATEEQRKIKEINSGILLMNTNDLKTHITELTPSNVQGELYLTDLVEIFRNEGLQVDAMCIEDEEEIVGINTRRQLAVATKVMQERINHYWMDNGVTLISPETIFIEENVEIEPDVVILPGTYLKGDTYVSTDCEIGPEVTLDSTFVGVGTHVLRSTVMQAEIGDNTRVGPYAYIRPNTVIGDNCRIGDFVEIKNSVIGSGTKVSHLTYVGDADLGEDINVGSGVVFVNYDGKLKQRSAVEDGAFIGCNTNIIAPLHVGKGAYIAAGTTLTEDVPGDSLAIGRSRVTIKSNWKEKSRE